MRSLLIAALSVVFFATAIFAMGKKDASKKETEQSLKPAKPAAVAPAKPQTTPAVKPAAAAVKPAEAAQKPAPAAPADKPGPDKAVVTVNGKKIMNSAVEARIDDAMKMQMGAMGGAMANLPPETLKSLRDRMRKDILDSLILEQLVDEKLKTDKVQVAEADVDAKLNEIMVQNSITLEKIQEELSKNGVTLEAFRDQLRRNIGIEKLIDAQIVAAGQATTATEEEAKAFYDENTAQFSTPEQVRASHILIKSDEKMDEAAQAAAKKKAEELLAKAKAGEDFAELAREHSEDPGSKAKGGEYVFPRGRMVKPFEDAAFGMEPGQVSDLVQTQYGYHIIKLSEKMPAETQTFEAVKDNIVQDLTNKKKSGFWMTLRETLKNEAKIEYSAEEKARMDAAENAVIRPHPQMQTVPPKTQPAEPK